MTSTFTLSRSDFVQFQKQAARVLRKSVPRGWGFLMQMGVWIFIGLAVSVYLRLYEAAFDHRRSIAIVGALLVMAGWAFALGRTVAARVLQKHLYRDGGPLLSPQAIELDEEGVSLVALQGLSSARYGWAAFWGRAEDERNLYLFLEPGYGVIVPKVALGGSGEELVRKNVREV